MSTLVAAGSAMALKKLIDEITKDLYAHFKNEFKVKIDRISALNNISSLHSKIEEVSKVKTIWQTDKSVQLSSFYCDTHIIKNGDRTIVKNVSDLKTEGNILIEGIAGQGKSIFLRNLCINELETGKVIPVFIELRRLTTEQQLMPMIHLKLKDMGFDIDDEIFRFLCNTNRMLFLLDGFDEVPDKMHMQLINEIDEIINVYKGIKLIISSRPDSGLEFLPSFNVLKVDYIKDDEYKDIIIKLSEDPEFAKSLIARVEEHKSEIKDLLCTPLMITLLVLTYKAYQKVPDQLSDFFESMFHLMLQRHDGTKPGYSRERRCELNDMEYQRVFEALCFITKEKGQSFKINTLNECSARAISIATVKADSQKYIQDINKITCLLVYEGKEYRFLHKSIQEYFASSFIKYKPDSVAMKFYSKMTTDGHKWHQEMLYLEEIDSFRFYKHLILPLCRKYLMIDTKLITKRIKSKSYAEILKNTYIYQADSFSGCFFSYGNLFKLLLDTYKFRADSRSILLNKLLKNPSFNKSRDDVRALLIDFVPKSNFSWASLKKIHDNGVCVEAINEYSEAIYNLIHETALDIQTLLKSEEKTDFMAFLMD